MYSQRHIEDLAVLCLQRLNVLPQPLNGWLQCHTLSPPLSLYRTYIWKNTQMKYMPSPFSLTPPTTSTTSSSATPTIMAVNGSVSQEVTDSAIWRHICRCWKMTKVPISEAFNYILYYVDQNIGIARKKRKVV